MKSRLDEAEDQISALEDKVEKNTLKEQEEEKGSERRKGIKGNAGQHET